ncbi:MAG: DUF362 domain-containing protein [Candidatus Woesearchaeota archaeon]
MSQISLVKTDDYSDIKNDIKKSLELLGGIKRFIVPGKRVLLKPNLFAVDALPHAMTDKIFLRAVIEIVSEAGGKPYIGELVASDQPGINKRAFKNLGIIDMAKETGVKLIDFQTGKFITTRIKNPLVLKTVDVAEKMKKFDLIINLPKFKSHGGTYITGAIKNCFGCIRPEQRGEIHKNYPGEDFSKAVVDTYSAMRFDLTIMDAVVAMDGDEGPAFGDPVNMGYVISGTDPVSIDALASKMTGHKISCIPLLLWAHKKRLGTAKIPEIEILGDKPTRVKFQKHKNYIINMGAKNKEKSFSYPEINDKCIRCAACLENCPVEAIFMNGNKMKIDYQKCIQCYRCLEACPVGAVNLKKKS